MKSVPRILPLIGVAIGGVLAVNALAGARDLPALLSSAKAAAEEAVKTVEPGKGKAGAKVAADKPEDAAPTGEAKDALAAGPTPPAAKPAPLCAPSAAELAKEAGLSPAELQVLQNLGERRGQLDKREGDLDTQMALLQATEAKIDAKAHALAGLKADVQNLLAQADGRQSAEVDRLVKVFEAMKPKDAAPRMVLLDDSVRLPIAAKMKDRALSAVVAQMPPAEAKKLTEGLAKRFTAAQTLAANAMVQADQAAAKVPAAAGPAPSAGAAKAADAKVPSAAKGEAKPKRKAPPHKKTAAKAAKAAPAAEAPPANAG